MGVAVRVQMFAALREAAGTGEAEIDPGPLPDVLAALCSAYGEPFATRLAICTVLLDGSAVRHDEPVDVAEGAELALLPPVSGGVGGDEARLGLPPASGGVGGEEARLALLPPVGGGAGGDEAELALPPPVSGGAAGG